MTFSFSCVILKVQKPDAAAQAAVKCEGRHFMSSILDEWKKEIVEETRKENEQAMREAEQEAIEKNSREIACRMIARGDRKEEEIAEDVGLPLEEVRKLSAQMTV